MGKIKQRLQPLVQARVGILFFAVITTVVAFAVGSCHYIVGLRLSAVYSSRLELITFGSTYNASFKGV